MSITGVVPDPAENENPQRRAAMERALAYMGLENFTGQKLENMAIDKVCAPNVILETHGRALHKKMSWVRSLYLTIRPPMSSRMLLSSAWFMRLCKPRRCHLPTANNNNPAIAIVLRFSCGALGLHWFLHQRKDRRHPRRSFSGEGAQGGARRGCPSRARLRQR